MATSPLIQAAILSVALPFLGGCSLTSKQKGAIRDFGDAASALGKVAQDELPAMRNTMVEINRDMIRANADLQQAGLQPAESVMGVQVLDLDGSLEPGVIKAALQATAGLVGYAEALGTLVDYDSDADLKTAAEKLSGSIKGMKWNGEVVLPDDEADAIGEIVRGVGGWFVEEQKKSAVRKVANAYKGVVTKLTRQLEQDFDPRHGGGGMASALFTRAKDHTALTFAILSGTKPQPAGWTRDTAMASYERAVATLRRLEVVYGAIARACNELEQANRAMVDVLDNDELDIKAIKSFFKSARDVVDSARVLVD